MREGPEAGSLEAGATRPEARGRRSPACIAPWHRTMVGTKPIVLPARRCSRLHARMSAASVKTCSTAMVLVSDGCDRWKSRKQALNWWVPNPRPPPPAAAAAACCRGGHSCGARSVCPLAAMDERLLLAALRLSEPQQAQIIPLCEPRQRQGEGTLVCGRRDARQRRRRAAIQHTRTVEPSLPIAACFSDRFYVRWCSCAEHSVGWRLGVLRSTRVCPSRPPIAPQRPFTSFR